MPLLIASLKSTPGLPGAGSNRNLASGALVAQTWATAVGAWAAGVLPASTTVAAAKTALQGTLATLFAAQRSTPAEVTALATALESAHMVFATAVGLGMAGYTPTPPAGTIGFADILTAEPRDTSQEAADDIADALDAWMKTGIAVLIAPPNTSLTWS